MEIPRIFESEYRFCLILWEQGPLPSGELARLCRERLDWKRSTTYTVIKRLSERGVVANEGGVVKALITKEQAQIAEIDELMESRFQGSLPAFIAAFARSKSVSEEELDQVQAMIDQYRRGEKHD